MRWVAVVVALGLLGAVLLFWATRPQRVSHFVVARIAASLGLEITASGVAEYPLRGTPRLVLRNVVARRPGDTPLLRADRIAIALPWSTLRARGADLTLRRVELDGPQLDLPALQRWLATRPPSEQRMPTLTEGLRIRDGIVANPTWRVEAIAVDLPSLRPGQPVRARLRGRYADPPTSLRFDLAVALTRPANDAGLGIAGKLVAAQADWSIPAYVSLSGPLHLGAGNMRIAPARIGISARYRSTGTDLPFALGLHGPLRYEADAWVFAPAGVALRGTGTVPNLDARGTLALGQRLVLQLRGTLAGWPQAWPALPPPIGASSSPLPFALDYTGATSFADEVALHLARDDASFDGRFRLPAVLAWIDEGDGAPIPPLQGRIRAAVMEVSGAKLEGIDVRIEDAGDGAP